MAKELSGSVGKRGINREQDVFAVQTYLMNWIRLGPLAGKVGVPPLSGKCDALTIQAIGVFQRVVIGMSYPDHLIDRNGKTFKRLSGPLTTAPVPPAVQPRSAGPDAVGEIKKTSFGWCYFPDGTQTLKQIGQKHGYTLDYGPIANFPLNPNLDDPTVRPARGEIIFVPWPEGLLRKLQRQLTAGLAASKVYTEELMAELDQDEAKINDKLLKIDMIAIVATMFVSFGVMVNQGLKRVSPDAVRLSAKELVRLSLLRLSKGFVAKDAQFVEMVVFMLDKVGSNAQLLSTLAIPAPQKPERGALFYLRHAFGPWNPSYWASIKAAREEGDEEIWLYGSSAVTYREKSRLQRNYTKHAKKVGTTIMKIGEQLTCKYYSAGSVISYDW